MTFPGERRARLQSTNPIERPNGEIRRRREVVRIFADDAPIAQLVGTALPEQNAEWVVQPARHGAQTKQALRRNWLWPHQPETEFKWKEAGIT